VQKVAFYKTNCCRQTYFLNEVTFLNMGGKGSGRRKIKSEHDAPNPKTMRGELKRDRIIFELLFGGEDDRALKNRFMQEVREQSAQGNLPQYRLTTDDFDCIIDIQRLWELGSFRNIPEVVASRLFMLHTLPELIDVDALADPNTNSSGWSNRALVTMGLEILRLYLMGVDPYMRKVIRNVLTVNGKKLNMKRLLHGVNHSAEALDTVLEYEDDEEFDFSSLSDFEF